MSKSKGRLSSVIQVGCDKLIEIKLTEEILEDIKSEGIELSRHPFVEKKFKPGADIYYADVLTGMWSIDSEPGSTFFPSQNKVFYRFADDDKFNDLLRRKYPELLL